MYRFSPKLSLWLPSLAQTTRDCDPTAEKIYTDFSPKIISVISISGDDSRAPSMCLVCGEVVCSQSYCCQAELDGEAVGACTAHAHTCGARVGIFLRYLSWCFVLHCYPDPHSLGCPGSGSILGMRIRIKELGNWPKISNIPGFLPFKKAFVSS